MIDWGRIIWRSGACVVLALLALGANTAHANTYSDTCTGCHADTATSPPYMPSQDSTFGLIMSELGQFTDNCQVTLNCVLRQLMAAQPAMAGFASGAGSFTQPQLEAVRLYLLQVRDDAVANPSPSYAFPSTLTTSNASITSTIAISNWRNASVVYHFAISGANAADFAITSATSGTCTAAPSITTATICSPGVSIRFSPSAGGARNATLNVSFTAAAGDPVPFTRSFSLSGTGVVPTPGFNISATTLTLSAKLGSSTTGSLTISNPAAATANLVLGTLVYSPSNYVLAGSSTCSNGLAIAPGGSCTVVTTFTPTAAGAQNGTLVVTHNAAGSPQTVTLNGTGTQSLISPTASPLAFDNVQLGVPKVLNLTVTNTGTASLVFAVEPSAASARTGAAKDDYAVGGTCHVASPLAPGGTCSLAVTFTPTLLGLRPATLTITSDATNGPLAVALTGTGVSLPEPVLTFPGSDFPDTVIGQTAAVTRTITIRNDRTRDIQYSVANITDFTIGSQSCATHVVTGGGGSCTVTVQFVPTLGAGEGRRQGTFAFTFTGTGGDADPSSQSGGVAGVALLPLALSTTFLNAAAVVGSPSTVSLVLTNRSATSLTLSSLAFSGASPGDYSLDPTNTCTPALALAASANCTLVIRFAPAAAGTRNAVLTLTHTAPGSPQTVTLNGTATPAPQGRIALSAVSLSFADTQLGSTSPQSATVVNSGDLALTFSAFTFGGAAAAEFTQGGTCSVASPLPIGGQCTLTVVFAPASLGLRNATLTIASDASNGAATLTLSGTGVPVPAPQVSLTPATLDFGNQTTGGLYPSRRVHLANSGTADLAIGSLVVAGTGFANVSAAACPPVLAPTAGCDIDITLLATSAIAYTGTLTVSSNAAGSPAVVVLRGNGSASALPVLIWSPAVTTLDFGQQSAGTVSAVQSVTLSNQGPGGVTLTVLNAIGADGPAFSVVGGTCSLVTPLFEGQTCRVDISFAPGSAGAKTAAVQIASTGSFPPTLTLTGVGLAGPNPSLALSAASIAFESTRVGAQSLPQDVRLTSTGSGVVSVSAMAVDGAYAIQSTTCPSPPFTLPAGSQCTVTVAFRPTAEGTSAGTLRVTTDAAPLERDVALSGSGQADAATGSGGCSIGSSGSLLDPSLWLMLLLAAAALLRRGLRRDDKATARATAAPPASDTEESAS